MLKSNSCIFSFIEVDRNRLLTEAAQALGLRIEDAHDGYSFPGVGGWAIKNTMNGVWANCNSLAHPSRKFQKREELYAFSARWDIH